MGQQQSLENCLNLHGCVRLLACKISVPKLSVSVIDNCKKNWQFCGSKCVCFLGLLLSSHLDLNCSQLAVHSERACDYMIDDSRVLVRIEKPSLMNLLSDCVSRLMGKLLSITHLVETKAALYI